MHIHIAGICGTFMGSLAQLAKALGHKVTGCDANVYPPMSTQLEAAGIELISGFDPEQLSPAPDLVVVGNALSRGNPLVEAVLDLGIPYTSGPQWLGDNLLQDKWVLAVSGTHGKTTTSSMLAWILEYAGLSPGFLIGGVPGNFGVSARLGETDFFVVEADEYDTAFFDKRSKFVHYHPRTLVMNNLEYDHADIFPNIEAIQRQFHHLIRTVPSSGLILSAADNSYLQETLAMGCWSPVQTLGGPGDWQGQLIEQDGSHFSVLLEGNIKGEVNWPLNGAHNVANGLAAIAAARHVGVDVAIACEALNQFEGVKRRLETLATINNVTVYDDFAHHPTAIATTLEGMRKKYPLQKIIAVIEPRSNTMKLGVHGQALAQSTAQADEVLWFEPEGLEWSFDQVISASPVAAQSACTQADLLSKTLNTINGISPGQDCHVVIMSNGGFGGFHQKLIVGLTQTKEQA